MSSVDSDQRVLSGMRPTGRMHLGHYHGALKNWVRLQHEYECFFFVADFHALTTHYQNRVDLDQFTLDMVVDWLAVGLSPSAATLFVQSKVPEHAELHLLLSMVTPVSWLERVPSYKDQQANLADRDFWAIPFCKPRTFSPTAPAKCRWAATKWRTWSSRARSPAASTTFSGASPNSRSTPSGR